MNRLMVYILLLAVFAFAEAGSGVCTVDSIAWVGEHEAFDESQMAPALGEPCNAWKALAKKLERYYEDKGFVAVRVFGNLRGEGSSHVLELRLERGPAYVWAPPENLENGGTKPEVFRRLSGIEEGTAVSITDLERSERKLARIGYFEQVYPVQLFRDASRNRIIPAYGMRKANVSRAEGLLTYSSEDDVWEGMVDVSLYNIAGTARDLLLEGFTGENSRHLTGSYKEPWIFGTPWNVMLRGHFDEESEPEPEREIIGEVGITRDIGFEFTVGIFLGISEDDKHSSAEISYVSLDRFVLPRKGWRFDGSLTWKMDRPDTLDNFLRTSGHVTAYFPLFGNVITRFDGAAGGIFPVDASLKRMDYFALGGLESFKGMPYRMLRSRSYGFSEFALLWQDGYDLSIEAFYQPGLYRRMSPGHGWAREQDYGIGFTQYRRSWSINLYYALRNGENYLDGVIGFGLKTLF